MPMDATASPTNSPNAINANRAATSPNPNMLIDREHDSRHLAARIEREKTFLRALGVEIS